MNLFVDDQRPAPPGWCVARSITEAVNHLRLGYVTNISLDYHVRCRFKLEPHSSTETFEPVARFLCLLPKDQLPLRINVHSRSETDAARLLSILQHINAHVTRIPFNDLKPRDFYLPSCNLDLPQ